MKLYAIVVEYPTFYGRPAATRMTAYAADVEQAQRMVELCFGASARIIELEQVEEPRLF